VSVAVKKEAILAPSAPRCPQPFGMSLSLLSGDVVSERPGAVKGAPLLGAAKRTLDGEDRSGRLEGERKARRRTNERWGKKMAPSLGATGTGVPYHERPSIESHGEQASRNGAGTARNPGHRD
jgi:hypothetical protein